MASYSDWSDVNKAGIDVWFEGLGGSVEGSVQGISAGQSLRRWTLSKRNVLAFTSIRSSFVNASPEIGSVPFSSMYRSIRAFSYTVPDVLETTGAVGGDPETAMF